MDKTIERIVRDNPTLDGAEVITTTVTREDRTRKHYYIFKVHGDTIDSRTNIPLPFSIISKENGKGRNRHYVVVAVMIDGYVVIDLNKELRMGMLEFGKYFTVDYKDAEEVVKFKPKPSFLDEMMEESL